MARHSHMARMDAGTPLTYEEFLAFAESAESRIPGFADNSRKYRTTVERFLPKISAKMVERAEKFRAMGFVVPARFFPVAAPPERSAEDYSHEELMALFRPAWELYKKARASGAVAG